MTVIISGNSGVQSVNGTASAPSVTGTDTDTGIVYGTNTLSLATGGTSGLTQDSSQNVGINTTTPRYNTSGATAGVTTLTVYNAANGGGGVELATASTTATASAGRLCFVATGNSDGSRAISWIDSLIQGSTSGNQGGLMRFATKADNAAAAVVMILNTGGSVALKGAVSTADGTGITFPATQSASTDANTLDDYEEGTWTPVLSSAGGTPTGTVYSQRNAAYTKVGRVVTVVGGIQLSTKGTGGSGEVYITGLPFANSATGGFGEGAAAVTIGYLTTASYNNRVTAFPVASGSYLRFRLNENDAALDLGEITNTTYTKFTATYFV